MFWLAEGRVAFFKFMCFGSLYSEGSLYQPLAGSRLSCSYSANTTLLTMILSSISPFAILMLPHTLIGTPVTTMVYLTINSETQLIISHRETFNFAVVSSRVFNS